jgi:myo-inositol-1(or 4)-monophosphatase
MRPDERTLALQTAVQAARAAARLQRDAFAGTPEVDEAGVHDIKLAVDRECEEAIGAILAEAHPDHAILGEEDGERGSGPLRWVVDPLDGTANFYYGVPHFCVSLALEQDGAPQAAVVLDSLRGELFTATKDGGAFLNGEPIRTSSSRELGEAIVVVGFMKDDETIARGLRMLQRLLFRVRKVRCTGSAALDLAYVASGRFTAYVESGIRLWDVAAGRLLVEEAGGRFDATMHDATTLDAIASNGPLHEAVREECDRAASG